MIDPRPVCVSGTSPGSATLNISGGCTPVNQPLVISQVYGGGGGTSLTGVASFKNDFIELHNRGTTPVSLQGLSVQYSFSSSTSSSTCTPSPCVYFVHVLPNVSLAAGAYFLLKEGPASANASLPDYTADEPASGSGPLSLSSVNGKVALVNGILAEGISAAGAPLAPAGAPGQTVLDFVGYGNANFAETTSTPALTTTTSASSKNSGCTDTDSNLADFTVGAVVPRSSQVNATGSGVTGAVTCAACGGAQ